MPPLRIVHVLVAPGRGGAEAMALALGRAQRAAGHAPSFLLLSESDFRLDVDAAGLQAVVADVPSAAHPFATWRAATVLLRLDPRIVHCHGSRAIAVAACARARSALTVVSTTHGNPAWQGRPGRSLVRTLLNRATVHAVAAVNQELARAEAERLAAISVVEIVNGVDVNAFRPADPIERRRLRTRLGYGAEEVLVACSSRLIPLKGVDVLLEAWAAVRAACSDATLVILGDGPERGRLERTATERFGGSVRFLGSVRDVPSVLRAADLFVFPSVRGCFGRSAIEALASGLPVIASRLVGTDRFVTDRESAWLCAPGDVGALSQALITLITDRTLAERLGSVGRRLAERRFSVEAMALAYEALYAEALHGPGRRSSFPP